MDLDLLHKVLSIVPINTYVIWVYKNMYVNVNISITFLLLKIKGKVVEMAGAAWTAGNAIFPITSESPNPNIPFTWLNVTHFWIRITFL